MSDVGAWLRRAIATVLLAAAAPHAPVVAQGGLAPAPGGELVVFAAASLKNALDAINAQWSKEGRRKAVISYASSPALAKQIEQGAPAHVFISADLDWMNYLSNKKLIKPETRTNLLGNQLVLVASKEKSRPIDISERLDLAALLGDGRLAMANIDSVPAGKYGKAALEKLGAWQAVSTRIAQVENVRAALLLVSRGEAPLGIVYRTDAMADPAVRVVGVFPASTHPAIIYPAAVTAGNSHSEASAYMRFLMSPQAKPLFEAQGFTVLAPGQS